MNRLRLDRNLWNRFFSTIRVKVLTALFLIVFVPLVILAIVTYARVSEDYRREIEYAANQAFDQAVGFISFKVNTLVNSSDVIHFNQEVQTILKRERYDIEEDDIQQYKDNLALERLIYSLRNDQDVFRVKFYVADWLSYAEQDNYFSSMSLFEESEAYKRLENYRGKVIWMPPSDVPEDNNQFKTVPVISMVRRIKDVDNLANTLGFIELALLKSTLDTIIDKADITTLGRVFLINDKDEIISSSDGATEPISETWIQLIDHNNQPSTDGQWVSVLDGEQELNIRYEEIEQTDWFLVSIVPESEIMAPAKSIREFIIVLYIIGGTVAFGLAMFLSKSLTDRIHGLSEHMLLVQEGCMDDMMKDKSQDELGQLNRSFNYMLEQIRILIEKQYLAGQELKNAELKALQAQINPHFLYNTLDMINWKARDCNADEIVSISQTLAKFYKLSLSNGKDIISIEDEINHVIQYLKIQNMRYENRLVYSIDIEEEILAYTIPKIILQPLVENAIIHGILKRTGASGIIGISGWMENDDVVLELVDNGMGIDQQKLNNLLSVGGTIESHGYGVRNIHERLVLTYGIEYGLTYMSELGKGTTVIIRIPGET